MIGGDEGAVRPEAALDVLVQATFVRRNERWVTRCTSKNILYPALVLLDCQ